MSNFPSRFVVIIFSGLVSVGCGAAVERSGLASETADEIPQAVYRDVGGLPLGDPSGSPSISRETCTSRTASPAASCAGSRGQGIARVSESPRSSPVSFRATSKSAHSSCTRSIPQRGRFFGFDNRGAYRDILIDFDEVASGRKVVPAGLDVDAYGRVAVSDTGTTR